MIDDNLKWWDRLAKTNPEHTKGFKRPGGFEGTAIKPIYLVHKMTELFGPCGGSWRISEPQFTLVNGQSGEIAVFCQLTVSIKPNGDFGAPIPGVGGDMVVKKRRDGSAIIDDEAFKKAYTDAVGNALKFLGMSADVHMGLFEDSKYVAELRREFGDEHGEPGKGDPKDRQRNGYQSRFVRGQGQPGAHGQNGQGARTTGQGRPAGVDDSVVINWLDDTTETAATPTEGARLVYRRMLPLGYFEATKLAGLNSAWLVGASQEATDAIDDLLNAKESAAKREAAQMAG